MTSSAIWAASIARFSNGEKYEPERNKLILFSKGEFFLILHLDTQQGSSKKF